MAGSRLCARSSGHCSHGSASPSPSRYEQVPAQKSVRIWRSTVANLSVGRQKATNTVLQVIRNMVAKTDDVTALETAISAEKDKAIQAHAELERLEEAKRAAGDY